VSVFRVGPDDAGERADVVVARWLGVPRARAQAALKAGEVTVSGVTVRPSHRVEDGDALEGTVEARGPHAPEGEDIPLDIRYRDDRVLVVSKPAGLVTHPAGGHETGTLVNALLGLGIPLGGEGTARPGIVHRLDKDTSGLILVALDDDALASLSAALKRRAVGRQYLALLRGDVASASGSVEAPVGRHPTARRKMAVVSGGRAAVTHYKVLAKAEGVTLVEAALETGRTHQIRVHFAHLRHPVVGDAQYGGRGEASRKLGLDRPFLHARRITFPHPDDGRVVEVTDALPADLKAALGAAGIATEAF